MAGTYYFAKDAPQSASGFSFSFSFKEHSQSIGATLDGQQGDNSSDESHESCDGSTDCKQF